MNWELVFGLINFFYLFLLFSNNIIYSLLIDPHSGYYSPRRMLWTLWRPWVWTLVSRRWSTWPTRSASTVSSTTRTSASSSSGSIARKTRRFSTRHFSRFPLHLSMSAEMIRDISQVICGTDPYPQNFRAKKWKIKDKYFTKADFQFMMRNLPVPVNEEDIDQMFEFADKDKDGRINYRCYTGFIIK